MVYYFYRIDEIKEEEELLMRTDKDYDGNYLTNCKIRNSIISIGSKNYYQSNEIIHINNTTTNVILEDVILDAFFMESFNEKHNLEESPIELINL